MLLVHLFVCFVRVSLCPLTLLLGVGGSLRFVNDFSINIFAYPDLNYHSSSNSCVTGFLPLWLKFQN